MLPLRWSSPDEIVIELKDVLQLNIGLAGWGLAAYQYWRNEFTKLPFVAFHHGPLKPGASNIGGTLIVRNRCLTSLSNACTSRSRMGHGSVFRVGPQCKAGADREATRPYSRMAIARLRFWSPFPKRIGSRSIWPGTLRQHSSRLRL